MRHLLATLALSSAVLSACAAKEEAPAADTAAAAPAPAPAGLTAAAIAGTWAGKSFAATGDSVTATWTVIGAADGSGKLVFAGAKDSVAYTSTFDADSMMSASSVYHDPTLPAGTPDVLWKSVGRMTADGKLAGTTTIRFASKPDSIVQSVRWEATRAP